MNRFIIVDIVILTAGALSIGYGSMFLTSYLPLYYVLGAIIVSAAIGALLRIGSRFEFSSRAFLIYISAIILFVVVVWLSLEMAIPLHKNQIWLCVGAIPASICAGHLNYLYLENFEIIDFLLSDYR